MSDVPHADDYGIAVLICAMSTLGVVFNAYGIIIIFYNPALSNVFGKLCFSHSVANLGVCTIFLIWGVPLTLTQNTPLAMGIFGKILGQINIFFWGLCVYSHLTISINRFLTITFPMKTKIWTTNIRVKIFIAAPWILSFLHVIPYFVYNDCYMAYLPTNWIWIWSDTTCGRILSSYVDKYCWFAVFVAMFILDLTAAYFLRRNQKISKENGFDDQGSLGAKIRAKHRQKREIRFFIQSCIQGAIFFYELTNFYVLANLDSNQYYIFFTRTFAWILCHVLDGLVLIYFNFKAYNDQRRVSVYSLTRGRGSG